MIKHVFMFIGFNVENKVDAATVTWNEFANTHSDPSKFKKYVIGLTQDGVKLANDESLDITSSFEISPLESSTEYEARIKVILHDFGESEFSDPITIKTLPAQIMGNKLKSFLAHRQRLYSLKYIGLVRIICVKIINIY